MKLCIDCGERESYKRRRVCNRCRMLRSHYKNKGRLLLTIYCKKCNHILNDREKLEGKNICSSCVHTAMKKRNKIKLNQEFFCRYCSNTVEEYQILSGKTTCRKCSDFRKDQYKKAAAIRRSASKRRALLVGLQEHFTSEERELLFQEFDYRCVKCYMKPESRSKLHTDHIIPLSKGGANTIDNIQPLCVHCNSSKCNREDIDYRDTARRIIPYIIAAGL